jgi:hypothetical protein
MARRQLLTDEQWTRLLAPPSDEREIVRYWTLSSEDFDIIFRKRSDHSRLGFALLLCYLRYPGRVLAFKVFWRKEGDEKGKRIAWMEEGRKPSEALAIFYCKVACAIEDGLEKYHYHDKALTPPRKDFKPRLRSLTTIELKRENE